MTTVPRTPATALGVRIMISSPGRIFSRATASANLPESSSIVDRPGTSVIVRIERSRTVTTALPPSSIRASDLSPVVTVSCRNTSSLNFSGTGLGCATRRAVTLPSSVVTTPARDAWARAIDGDTKTPHSRRAKARLIISRTAPGEKRNAPRWAGVTRLFLQYVADFGARANLFIAIEGTRNELPGRCRQTLPAGGGRAGRA